MLQIQCLARGVNARVYRARLSDQQKQHAAASLMARIYRGHAGRVRMHRKRALVHHAHAAAKIVDVRNLFPSDLMELAEAIALPLVDSTRPFPPAAVLGLMRIVVTVLGSEQAGDTVASFSRIGIKHARPVTVSFSSTTRPPNHPTTRPPRPA